MGTAREKLKAAWAFLARWSVLLLSEWWADIGEKPRPHLVTFVMAIPLYEFAWAIGKFFAS